MRLAFVPLSALMLAGCLYKNSKRTCVDDEICDTGEVCAAYRSCEPVEELRTVTTTWTLGLLPANATTCAATPTLWIGFERSGTHDGFVFNLQMPCEPGQLVAERVPIYYDTVVMGVPGSRDVFGTIDADNRVMIDFARRASVGQRR